MNIQYHVCFIVFITQKKIMRAHPELYDAFSLSPGS